LRKKLNPIRLFQITMFNQKSVIIFILFLKSEMSRMEDSIQVWCPYCTVKLEGHSPWWNLLLILAYVHGSLLFIRLHLAYIWLKCVNLQVFKVIWCLVFILYALLSSLSLHCQGWPHYCSVGCCWDLFANIF
jgi:hypothetical protein